MRPRTFNPPCAILLFVFMTLVCAAGAGSNRVQVASAPWDVSRTAAGGSFAPVWSADGQYIAFISYAKNLVTNDDFAECYDVFIRDLTSNTTTLVSANLTGIGGGNDHSISPAVGSNGQVIAFSSEATDLVSGDTNRASDIFVRDLTHGVTRLASINLEGTGPGNGASKNPRISDDGRFVFFESTASNLVLNDTNGASDVFVRDLEGGTTALISINSEGTGSANGASQLLHVTPDGRFVAFFSTASNIYSTATSGKGDAFVKDLQTGVTYWATKNIISDQRRFQTALSADGRYLALQDDSDLSSVTVTLYRCNLATGTRAIMTGSRADLSGPAISADGQVIAFSGGGQVGLWRLDEGTLRWIQSGSEQARNVMLSADGQRVLFAAGNAANLGNRFQVFAWDGITNRLVTANLSGGPASANSQFTMPLLSRDGRFVAFDSSAEDLVSQDLNKASDVFVADLSLQSMMLVSQRNSSTAPPATGTASTRLYPGAFNANGQKLLFVSHDSVLVGNDTNLWQDLFIRDFLAITNIRGTVVTGLCQTLPASIQTNSAIAASFSADGRFVSVDMTFGYPNSSTNSYRFDNSNAPLDLSLYGGAASSMSSDGQLVAFHTSVGLQVFLNFIDFSGVDTNNNTDVVVRRFRDPFLSSSVPPYPIFLGVSVNQSGAATGNRSSWAPLISSDGLWVAFSSLATDLTTNVIDPNGAVPHLFARNLLLKTTRLLDRDTNGLALSGSAINPVFSADSRFVFFGGTTDHAIYRHDLLFDSIRSVTPHTNAGSRTNFQLLPNLVVCSNCANPSISGDGQLVAYETRLTDAQPSQVFLRNIKTSVTELISLNSNRTEDGNGASTVPQLSYDARYVVFASKASNLVANDFNGANDIFVRDRWKNVTSLLSSSFVGTGSANGASSRPVLSPDGRTVAFGSLASDLVAGDYNDTRDIFFVHFDDVDSDGDGMDDDWELHYFGTLTRDGTGDFDGDGFTDLQEFRAGTDPSAPESSLRMTGLDRVYYADEYYGKFSKPSWSSAPGRVYQLQFKRDINSPVWENVPGTVVAAGTKTSKLDNVLTTQLERQRFYRVLLLRFDYCPSR